MAQLKLKKIMLTFLALSIPLWSHAAAQWTKALDKRPSDAELRAIVYDPNKALDDRVEAVKTLLDYPNNIKESYRVCIFDPIGRAGLIFAAAKEQELRIESYGISVDFVPFINESVLVEEFKSGVCDVALMSGLRARSFNKFTGTLDAIGAIYNWDQARLAYKLMAHPQLASKMVEGDYVTMGIAPAGAAHVFVNDRTIDSIEKAAGKRVLVLDYDPMQAKMVSGLGATPVVSDLANAGNKFNNRNVDVLAAPLIAYNLMELYKGLEPDGGIIDIPLTYISVQLLGRSDVVPNEAAQLVREAMFNEAFDRVKDILTQEIDKIPRKWFVQIPDEDKLRYDKLMQEVRLKLVDEQYYDPEMLTILRKIRCKNEPGRAECSNPVE